MSVETTVMWDELEEVVFAERLVWADRPVDGELRTAWKACEHRLRSTFRPPSSVAVADALPGEPMTSGWFAGRDSRSRRWHEVPSP